MKFISLRHQRRVLDVRPAGSDEAIHQSLHRPPRHQDAEAGFVDAKFDSVEVDRREALGHFCLRQHLGRQAGLLVRGDRIADVRFLLAEEEQDAARMKDRQARGGAQRLPFRQRIPRHARVDRIPPISRADQPGLSPGRGAAVRGPVRVDQRHAMARALEMRRGPGAEHAGADDGNLLAHASAPNGSSSRGGQTFGVAPRLARNASLTISACCSSP